jgi:hypothetical protein
MIKDSVHLRPHHNRRGTEMVINGADGTAAARSAPHQGLRLNPRRCRAVSTHLGRRLSVRGRVRLGRWACAPRRSQTGRADVDDHTGQRRVAVQTPMAEMWGS